MNRLCRQCRYRRMVGIDGAVAAAHPAHAVGAVVSVEAVAPGEARAVGDVVTREDVDVNDEIGMTRDCDVDAPWFAVAEPGNARHLHHAFVAYGDDGGLHAEIGPAHLAVAFALGRERFACRIDEGNDQRRFLSPGARALPLGSATCMDVSVRLERGTWGSREQLERIKSEPEMRTTP